MTEEALSLLPFSQLFKALVLKQREPSLGGGLVMVLVSLVSHTPLAVHECLQLIFMLEGDPTSIFTPRKTVVESICYCAWTIGRNERRCHSQSISSRVLVQSPTKSRAQLSAREIPSHVIVSNYYI